MSWFTFWMWKSIAELIVSFVVMGLVVCFWIYVSCIAGKENKK